MRHRVKFSLSPVERTMVNGFGYRFWFREHVTRLNNQVEHHWKNDDKWCFWFWATLLVVVPLAYIVVPVFSSLLKKRLLDRLILNGTITLENETNLKLLRAVQERQQTTLH